MTVSNEIVIPSFQGYPPGSLVRWYSPHTETTHYGTVIESNESMTLVRCEFTGWIETAKLTFIV